MQALLKLDRTSVGRYIWVIALTLFAFLLRLPYWDVIPASFDEVDQTSYAFLIAQGQQLPLVGNDSYAGPFYFYLLAGLLRLGILEPMVGRLVVLVSGTLTVPVTYIWVSKMGKSVPAGFVAAFLIAINPDMIVVNSHVGGVTLLLPLFTTLFFLFLTLAKQDDKKRWFIAAGVFAGLALQANLLGALYVGSGFLWFFLPPKKILTLGKGWFTRPVLAIGCMMLVYSPVILYNLTTHFDTVAVLQTKSYLWQDNPTLATTLSNLQRLSLQTIRQMSGVLTGNEQISDLVGVPLLYLALMVTALIYTTRAVSTLPLFILGTFWLIFPVISNHYGFITVGRFTSPLIPVWAAVLGVLAAKSVVKPKVTMLVLSGVILTAYPLVSLWQYYQEVQTHNQSGLPLLALTRYAVAENKGEPVYLSSIEALSFEKGIPYVPHAAFLMADIHHEFLPAGQIIGRLFEFPGPAFFILTDSDAALIEQTAPLQRIDIPANDLAGQRQFGLYHLESSQPLTKPDFVIPAGTLPPGLQPTVLVEASLLLNGCEVPDFVLVGQPILFHCYWQAKQTMPPGNYVTFAHLLSEDQATLIAQDDHILGQERYPLGAWQPNEIIVEGYRLPLPAGLPPGNYSLWLGIYRWPELERLSVPNSPEQVIMLPTIQIIEAVKLSPDSQP